METEAARGRRWEGARKGTGSAVVGKEVRGLGYLPQGLRGSGRGEAGEAEERVEARREQLRRGQRRRKLDGDGRELVVLSRRVRGVQKAGIEPNGGKNGCCVREGGNPRGVRKDGGAFGIKSDGKASTFARFGCTITVS